MFLAVSILLIFVVLSLDFILIHRKPLSEGIPEFDLIFLIRITLNLIASCIFVFSLSGNVFKVNTEKYGKGISSFFSKTTEYLVYIFIVLCNTYFLATFLFDPVMFNYLGLEDNSVESLSSWICFINCGVFTLLLLKTHKFIRTQKKYFVSIIYMFIISFFLIGMEEISWGQRIIGFETPEIFKTNFQNEFNLHNFATNKFENLYYFGAFLFLVFIPFLIDNLKKFYSVKFINFFKPSKFIVISSAILTAYNYDMWNIPVIQLGYFISIFIVIYYMLTDWFNNSLNVDTVLILFSLIVTQTAFLMFGENFIRIWDVTEYKEFYIPFMFLLYSLELAQKIRYFEKEFEGAIYTRF
ncbi:MAG: 30S ribosomal protein S12 [uncultured bacterium]|nr:MAG: 30S ribosomal protein S12 [uncultured bacterium]